MGRLGQAHPLSRPGLALLALLVAACGPGPPPGPTNVLLLTVDTLRADRLGCYGHDRDTSPAIDALAGEGVLFRNAIASRGGTWPSLTSLLTSTHPQTHGVRANGDPLDAPVEALAETLSNAGYVTVAVLANMTTARHPGFQWTSFAKRGSKGARDDRVVDEALAWLDKLAGRPFFLWVHLLGPHSPYRLERGAQARFAGGYTGAFDGSIATLRRIHAERLDLDPRDVAHIVSLYDENVADADARVARVLAGLAERDLRDETLVVFGSDHGEELFGHNHYFEHSWSIYDSVLRVPLLLRLPGRLPAGREVETVVQGVDVAPTILDLVGVPAPATFEGRSLVPLVRGDAEASGEEAVAFSELGPFIHSVRSGRWRYVANPRGYTSPAARPADAGDRGVFAIAEEELYDLAADPAERHDVAARHPDVAARLRARLEAFVAGDGGYTPRELPPATRDELEALGYVVD